MDDDGPDTVYVTIGAARQWAALDDAPALCRQAVRATLARAAPVPWIAQAEVSILLADDRMVRQLNARYRNQDRPTNVLSFPALELTPGRAPAEPSGPALLGDIVLGAETVCAEAERAQRPLGAHLCHLVVHGSLHLLGFDHQDDPAASAMEALERAILADLGIPDPYAHADGDAASAGEHAREAL